MLESTRQGIADYKLMTMDAETTEQLHHQIEVHRIDGWLAHALKNSRRFGFPRRFEATACLTFKVFSFSFPWSDGSRTMHSINVDVTRIGTRSTAPSASTSSRTPSSQLAERQFVWSRR